MVVLSAHHRALACGLRAEEVLARAGLRAGMRFLEVSAGTGGLSIQAARLGATVLAADRSPAMVAALGARAREQGLSGVVARVMDAGALELDDDTFDVSASLDGVALFSGGARGVAEMARVTEPGGRVVIAGRARDLEVLRFLWAAVRAVVPGARPADDDREALDPPRLREAMAGSGVSAVHIEPVVHRVALRSGSRLWERAADVDRATARVLAALSDEQGTLVRAVLDGMLRERARGNGPAILTETHHVAIGTA